MNRRQIGAVLTLRRLGFEPKLTTFNDRLVAQKAIYLVQAAGVDLGYFYSWYLRGPYCPALTEDLFGALSSEFDREIDRINWTLEASTRRRLDRLKTVVDEPGQTTEARARRLELLASVHFLITHKQVADEHPKTIAERLRQFGKNFNQGDVAEAVVTVREITREVAT